MSVTRVHEDPRVTKPYTDAQWAAIDALGQPVDGDLAAHDVRLTQGGEPTFVSIDDMEGAEWNYAALSPKKRELAEILLRRLAGTLRARRLSALSARASGIPGEPLPRWALGVYWRADGVAAVARSPRCSPTRAPRATPTSAPRSASRASLPASSGSTRRT